MTVSQLLISYGLVMDQSVFLVDTLISCWNFLVAWMVTIG
jgi:hypothetical protein